MNLTKKNHNPLWRIKQITFASFILSISVTISLFEFKLPFPGVILSFRILDNLIILLSIPLLNIFYACTIAFFEPLIHFLIDPDHLFLEIILLSIANFLVTLITYNLWKNIIINKRKIIFFKSIILIIINTTINVLKSILFLLIIIISKEENQDWLMNIKNISLLTIYEFVRFLIVYLFFTLISKKIKNFNL
jgi:hypothetical protein